MSNGFDASILSSDESRLARLIRNLTEAETALAQMVGTQVDAVVSPEHGMPILLHQARETLLVNERFFRALFEGTQDGILIANDDGKFLDANPAAERLFGLPLNDLLGKHPWDFSGVPANAREIWAEFLTRQTQEGIYPLVHADGSLRWVDISARANFLPGQHLAVLRDVTERHELQQALNAQTGELHARMRDLQSLYRVAELISDRGLDFNALCEKIAELVSDALRFPQAMAWIAIGSEIVAMARWGDYAHSYLAPISSNSKLIGELCVAYPVSVETSPADAQGAFTPSECALVNAIALRLGKHYEQLEAEQTLHTTRNRLDAVVDSAAIALFTLDRAGIFTFVAGPVLGRVGVEPANLLGQSVFDLFPDRADLRDHFVQLLDGEQIHDSLNFGGAVLEVISSPHYNAQGVVDGVTGVAVDITKRVLAEQAQQRAEARYAALIDAAPDAILTVDAAQKITLFNQSAERMFGYTAAEILQQPLDLLIPSAPATMHHLNVDRVAQDSALPPKPMRPFVQAMRRAGSAFPAETSYSQTEENGNVTFTVIVRDITEKERVATDLRERATQLELLYQAGLAMNREHDAQAQMILLLETAAKALHADRAALWSYDASADALKYEIAFGSPPRVQTQAAEMRFPLQDDRGLAAVVARTRTAMKLPDVQADPRWIATEPDIHSAVWAPVVYHDQLFGVLSVACLRVNAFPDSAVQVLVLFANQFAAALQNSRLLNETRRRVHQLQSFQTIDNAISASFDLKLILDIYLDIVLNELHVDAADILLFDPVPLTLTFAAGRGFRTRGRAGQTILLQDPLARRVVVERRIVKYPDPVEGFPTPEGVQFATEGFKSYLGLPLVTKGQLKGVLEIFHRSLLNEGDEWQEFLNMFARQAAIAIDNVTMFDALQRSNYDLGLAYDATIEGWSHALDLRDRETEGHTQRVTELTLRLVQRLEIPENEWEHIRRGALLHDIGKMGIPDSILLKPGALSPEEWMIMKQHPRYAYDLLSPIAYLRAALAIPYCHHERWDGSGYPRGLRGEEIPLAARAFAVVDVWDALTSVRPYRQAWDPADAKAYLLAQCGTAFEPRIVSLFLEMLGN